jgi:site-specific DNA recombinase
MVNRWEAMNVSQQRAIISATVHTIAVGAANPRKRWDPDRFTFDWIA